MCDVSYAGQGLTHNVAWVGVTGQLHGNLWSILKADREHPSQVSVQAKQPQEGSVHSQESPPGLR